MCYKVYKFQAVSSHFQTFVAILVISSRVEPFIAILNNFQPSQVISSHLPQFQEIFRCSTPCWITTTTKKFHKSTVPAEVDPLETLLGQS